MASVQDNNSLLIYRVGPVLCCAPSIQIQTIIQPPSLTRPPGTSSAQPGIFKHASHIFSTFDLRYKFGVEEKDQAQPGRMILTEISKGHVGFWVDGIISVLEMPQEGWGALPAGIPRGVFSRTLISDEKIHLYADFDKLFTIQDSGYLKIYIQQLTQIDEKKNKPIAEKREQTKSQTEITSNKDKNESGTIAAAESVPEIKPEPIIPSQNKPGTISVPESVPEIKPESLSTPKQQKEKIDPLNKPPVKPPVKPIAKPVVAGINNTGKTTNISTHKETNKQPEKTIPAIQPTQNTQPATLKTATIKVSDKNTGKEPLKPDSTTNSQPVRADENTSAGLFMLLFIILLFFGGAGGGLWYFLSPKDSPVIYEVSKSTTIDEIKKSKSTPSYNRELPEPPSDAYSPTENIKSVDKQDEEPVSPSSKVVQNSDTPPTEEPTRIVNTEKYHASINQDQDGITIVLDAPANDSVFKTETLPEKTSEVDNQADAIVPAPKANATEVQSKTTIIHIVVKGDTLWHIAITYVNNPYRYPELARLSNIKNPDLIYPGNRVRIIKRKRPLQ